MKNLTNTKTSEKDCAQTPWWFIKALEQLLGLNFYLDVCANDETAKAVRHFSLDEDGNNGLLLPWDDVNFCNPPFSNITPWIEKAAHEATMGKTTAMIMPNNPETKYVRLAKEAADTIIEMPFRLKFLRPDGSDFDGGPQFSCLVALITPLGLVAPTRTFYYDFRKQNKRC